MSQAFIGRLFNLSDSGGQAIMNEWIDEQIAPHGSPAESHTFFVAAPTVTINNIIFSFVVLSNIAGNGLNTVLGSTVNSATYEISADGGAALITAMNNFANFAEGSPAAATTLVRSLSLTSFENLPMCSVVMSD